MRTELWRSKAPAAAVRHQRKTATKWRSRPGTEHHVMGPKERIGAASSALEETAIVSLRVQARLPPDHVHIALKKADREKPKLFESFEIGYINIDIEELRYEGGKAFLFVAVDRTSKIIVTRI